MITDLNQVVKGEAPKVSEYLPIPKGEYLVKVAEIKPWESKVKDIYVNKKDENGWLVKDERGNKVTELVKDCTFYMAKVVFEILDEGDFKGKKISDNLTTHPNAMFITENFLYAVDVGQIALNEIQNKCVGLKLIIGVDVESYTKTTKTKDKETGEETSKEEQKETNRIKSYQKLPEVEGL